MKKSLKFTAAAAMIGLMAFAAAGCGGGEPPTPGQQEETGRQDAAGQPDGGDAGAFTGQAQAERHAGAVGHSHAAAKRQIVIPGPSRHGVPARPHDAALGLDTKRLRGRPRDGMSQAPGIWAKRC